MKQIPYIEMEFSTDNHRTNLPIKKTQNFAYREYFLDRIDF
jgi:hypothetical protein